MAAEHENVIQALIAICDARNRIEAESYLQYAETNVSGYYSLLQHIYLGNRHSEPVRTLAAIAFKNGIDKYWRKSAKNALSAGEREAIKTHLLALSRDTPSGIVRQNSVSIAKIARLDFPLQWTNPFEELIQVISACQSDESLLWSHMYTLYQVTKSICSLRIGRARENFQAVAPPLMNFILTVYSGYSQQWMAGSSSIQTLRISDLALKTARCVICHGFELPYKHEVCQQFFTLAASQVPRTSEILFSINHTGTKESTLLDAVAKHLLHSGKLFLALSSNSMDHSMNHNFILMPGSMEVIKMYWTTLVTAAVYPTTDFRKIVIQGLVLLKQCIKLCSLPESHIKLMGNAEQRDIREAIQRLHTDLLSPESRTKILETLVTKFFILSADDLEAWEVDPEAWMLSQDIAHWQIDLRPCAEVVFLDLFSEYKSSLTEPIMAVLRSTSGESSGPGVALKEAMYNALGIAACHLFESFDFDSFLDQLHAEAKSNEFTTIFKRRILILISQWFHVKCGEARRPLVYEIVGEQLQAQNSTGLRLAAAFAVEKVVDFWEWDKTSFEPYCSFYVDSLVQCLALAEEIESKMKILTSLGLIIERMGTGASINLDQVLKQIPLEWDNCGEQHLLKVALLGLLTRLALTRGLYSSQGYSIVLPLIKYSTDANNFEHVYLIEEALEIWHAILQNAVAPDQHLLQLIPILSQPIMLPSASDTLQSILLIIESNLLLFKQDDSAFSHLRSLLQIMVSMLSELRTDALSHFAKVLSLGTQILTTTCFTDQDLWTISTLFLHESQEIINTVSIMCLMSQIILSDTSRMATVWRTYSQEDITRQIVERMFEKFDNIGHSKHRKLCAMAITALIRSNQPLFQDGTIAAGLGNIWSDVLAEVQANAGCDLVYWVDEAVSDELLAVDTAEFERRKDIARLDPVCTTGLKSYIRYHSDFINKTDLGVDLKSFLD